MDVRIYKVASGTYADISEPLPDANAEMRRRPLAHYLLA